MAYATVEDLIERYGEVEIIQLTDRLSPPSEAVVPSVALAALVDASNFIDANVAAVYQVPVSPAPPVLRQLCCRLARWNLYREPTDKVSEDYKDAVAFLQRIGKGLATLPGVEPNAPTATAPGQILMDAPERLFTRDRMRGL